MTTIAELIEQLSTWPGELPIIIDNDQGQFPFPIEYR